MTSRKSTGEVAKEESPKTGSVNEMRTSSFSIFDLYTSSGQITFILVIAAIAVLIQTLPKDFLSRIELDSQADLKSDRNEVKVTMPPTIVRPKYIIYNPRSKTHDHLVHVKEVLDRINFSWTNESNEWDLMWAHDYPFLKLPDLRTEMKSHQRINHFPGSGFITNKVDLALTESDYIPKAFRLPQDADKFQEYAKKHPDKEFVQKHNQHRHIYLKTISDIDTSDNDTFIQEYMSNPLLVDGKKFDIGAYVVVTSVNPLRIYVYSGDYLLRFCPEEYNPFDRTNLDKYVVGDDYTPIWQMPSLKEYHDLGFSMMDSLNAHLQSLGRDPSVIWDQIHDSIREVLLKKEKVLTDTIQRFKYKRNFFELMRFDFILDENLRIFLLEANMSPNLSSAHFKPNRLLYEQVIYNTLGLVGIALGVKRESLRPRDSATEAMMSSMKNIAINAQACSTDTCHMSCDPAECLFCRSCLSTDDLNILHTAFREHMNRGDMRRIFPLASSNDYTLSPRNLFMSHWFAQKCQKDSTFCS
ncbi:TTLL6 [Sergentomyia squamirostris]